MNGFCAVSATDMDCPPNPCADAILDTISVEIYCPEVILNFPHSFVPAELRLISPVMTIVLFIFILLFIGVLGRTNWLGVDKFII